MADVRHGSTIIAGRLLTVHFYFKGDYRDMAKLKHVLITAAVLAVAVLALTGCGKGSGSDVTIDPAKLADSLNTSVITNDKLTQTSSDMLGTIYFFEDGQVVNSKAYMSSGATADEICIAEAKDADAANAVVKLFKTRVENQKNLYKSYNADEVTKLDSAIIDSEGKYAVLVVCDDYEKAKTLLKDAGFSL